MKRNSLKCLVLSLLILTSSCMIRKQVIRSRFSQLHSGEDVTVVVVGNALYSSRWLAETESKMGIILKKELGGLLDVDKVSVINSGKPDDTVNALTERIEADVLSYKPDMVFLMLGAFDSSRNSVSLTTYRQQLRKMYGILREYDVFVVVLTAPGMRDARSISMERLNGFNDITLWEAGHHNFPVIDVAAYTERLRKTSPYEYRKLFRNEMILNDDGIEYVMGYIMKNLKKTYSKRD